MGLVSSIQKIFTQKKSTVPWEVGGYQACMVKPGAPVWTRREFAKFAEEAYIRNVIAYRAINKLTTAATSVPFVLYENNSLVEKHPLLTLLKRPNPQMAGAEFFEHVYAMKLISGNSYIHAVANDAQMPVELYSLRPDRVTVVAGKNGLPSAYRYTVGDSVRHFPIDRFTGKSVVLHLKHFHPLDDWYGLSPIEAAAYAIDQHNQAGQWNQALLQNGARPSGALLVKSEGNQEGYLNEEQFQHLKQQLMDSYSSAANAGKPMLLEGGLQWQEMSLTPKDMDFIETKYSAARDIALAFGVPPQLLGIPGDNTYSNLAEARLAMWEQTIIPMMDNMVDNMNNWLSPFFGNSYSLGYNKDTIGALAPRREKIWSWVQNADFMTINEKRKAVGLSPVNNGDII